MLSPKSSFCHHVPHFWRNAVHDENHWGSIEVFFCVCVFCRRKKVTLLKNHKKGHDVIFFYIVVTKQNKKYKMYIYIIIIINIYFFTYFEFCNLNFALCFRVNGNFCKMNGIKLPLLLVIVVVVIVFHLLLFLKQCKQVWVYIIGIYYDGK